MAYTIKRLTKEEDIEHAIELNKLALPESAPYEDSEWWGAFDGARMVGYAAARAPDIWPGNYFLSRAGVVYDAQGKRLQVRLIQARVARARQLGLVRCVTYTSPANVASMRSLIRAGFRPYTPEYPYAGWQYVYWSRQLT